MIIIPGVQVDGIYGPSQPIPDTAVYVEFDGSNYHVYIPGDTLPLPDPATLSKSGPVVSPESLGAMGDGNADDSYYFTGPPVALTTGKTYRISSSVTTSAIFACGGIISVDAGVTLSVPSIVGDPAGVIFTGLGTVKMLNNMFSIGHYQGLSVNEKWDFCRRGFYQGGGNSGQVKTVHCPRPLRYDPSASLSDTGTNKYKLSGPLRFDDPENSTVLTGDWDFYCTSETATVVFSESAKTENIEFREGLKIDGANVAIHPITFYGGARIKFNGVSRVTRSAGSPVYWRDTILATDEIEFDFLELTDFSGIGFDAIESGSNASLGCSVRHLFTNGCKQVSGVAQSSSFVKLQGRFLGFRIDKITVNIPVGSAALSDFTDSVVLLSSDPTVNLSPRDVFLVEILQVNSNCLSIRTIDATAGAATTKNGFFAQKINPSKTTGVLVGLTWAQDCWIGPMRPGHNTPGSITVDTTCVSINVTSSGNAQVVSGTCDRLMINGMFTAYKSGFGQNQSFSFGIIDLSVIEITGNNGIYGLLSFDGTVLTVISGPLIDVSTPGPLLGATGPTGKLNVAFLAGKLYVEQRVVGSANLMVRCKP